MKNEQEIRLELDRLYAEEGHRGNFKAHHITPRNWGKIRALEWVLKGER